MFQKHFSSAHVIAIVALFVSLGSALSASRPAPHCGTA